MGGGWWTLGRRYGMRWKQTRSSGLHGHGVDTISCDNNIAIQVVSGARVMFFRDKCARQYLEPAAPKYAIQVRTTILFHARSITLQPGGVHIVAVAR